MTKRVDALYHRGLSWPLCSDLRNREDLALVAMVETLNDDELWALVRLPSGNDGEAAEEPDQ